MRSFIIAPLALATALAACSGGTPAGNQTAAGGNATSTTASTETASAEGDYPKVRPGAWEMKMAMPGPSGNPIDATMKMCVGEPKPGENPFAPKTVAGTTCTNEVKSTSSGWEVASECTGDGVTTKTKGIVTGDPQSAYKSVLTSTSTGENVPPYLQKETETTIEARRLGDCPAGVNPGQPIP